MRMRTKKHGEERMNAVSALFASCNEQRIDLDKTFEFFENKSAPLYLEIGCGKGSFIVGMSKRFPDVRLLAFEKVRDVLMLAMERAEREKCENIRFHHCDVSMITEMLPAASVDRLYINFCDPWPKARTAKRRLTSPLFLERYKVILKDGARIYFKTDNRPLFDYSVIQFAENGFVTENVCYDLHASNMDAENIRTEYENNFSMKGFKINYLEAFLKRASE